MNGPEKEKEEGPFDEEGNEAEDLGTSDSKKPYRHAEPFQSLEREIVKEDRSHPTSDPQDESYWFSTFLQPSLGDRTRSAPPAETVFSSVSGRDTLDPEESSSGESLLASQFRAPSLSRQARDAVATAFAAFQSKEYIQVRPLEGVASQIVSNIALLSPNSFNLLSPVFSDSLFSRVQSSFGEPCDLVDHSIHVAIISVMLAQELKLPKEDLLGLCEAALLHDVGMLMVPPSVWDHSRPLSEEEKETVRYHTELGQDLVSMLEEPLSALAPIVGQEHERADGNGYPNGLKDEDIHHFAKIIGMADVFEALTHVRPYRPAFTLHQAVRKILTEMRSEFNHDVLRGLIGLFTIFPMGSIVELDTGEVGRVVQVNRGNQLRPTVEVLRTPEGHPPHSPSELELEKHPESAIARCLDDLPDSSEGPVASDPTQVLE